MEQNKTGKYLKYAIGEIVLVVIGILIAVSINNWNENRKLVNEGQYLLAELKFEFESNLNNVIRDIDGNTICLNAAIDLLDLFHLPKQNLDEKKIDSLVMALYAWTSFDAVTGVLDEIINSGKLRVIQDDSLRFNLSKWSGLLRDQQEDITFRGNFAEQTLMPYLAKTYPIKNTDITLDMSYWSDVYKRRKKSRSKFNFNPDEFFTLELEGLLEYHSLHQEWILLNNFENRQFINKVLEQIETNLNND